MTPAPSPARVKLAMIAPGLPDAVLDAIPGKGTDLDRFWPAYQAARAAHAARVETSIRDCLAEGGTVYETLFGKRRPWTLPTPTFIEPFARSPEYVAEHLANRHQGFGSTLELAAREGQVRA